MTHSTLEPLPIPDDPPFFYRVEEQERSDTQCRCPECLMWTVVYNDGEPTEIGTSWQGEAGKEAAEDVCDLMNMAFDAGRESYALRETAHHE